MRLFSFITPAAPNTHTGSVPPQAGHNGAFCGPIDFFTQGSHSGPADAAYSCLHRLLPSSTQEESPLPYPREVMPSLLAFFGGAYTLCRSLMTQAEQKTPFHLAVLETLEPNVVSLQLEGGARLIGLSLGLIPTLGSEDELAFLLAYQLECFQTGEGGLCNPKTRSDFLMRRSHFPERVDRAAVQRLLDQHRYGYASVNWLQGMRGATAFVDYTFGTRINSIEKMMVEKTRGGEETVGRRLHEGDSECTYIRDAQADLRTGGALFQHIVETRIRPLLKPHGLADEAYKAIRDNVKFDVGGRDCTYDFQNDFERVWNEIECLLPPDFDPKQKILWQLELFKNIDQDREDSRSRILGPDFCMKSAWQVEAEERLRNRYGKFKGIPNLIEALQVRDRCQRELKQERDSGADTTRIQTAQKNLEEAGKNLEMANLFFESNQALEDFVAGGYLDYLRDRAPHGDGNARMFFDPDSVSGHIETIGSFGFRIRGIHDIVARSAYTNPDLAREALPLILATDVSEVYAALVGRNVGFYELPLADREALYCKGISLIEADPDNLSAAKILELVLDKGPQEKLSEKGKGRLRDLVARLPDAVLSERDRVKLLLKSMGLYDREADQRAKAARHAEELERTVLASAVLKIESSPNLGEAIRCLNELKDAIDSAEGHRKGRAYSVPLSQPHLYQASEEIKSRLAERLVQALERFAPIEASPGTTEADTLGCRILVWMKVIDPGTSVRGTVTVAHRESFVRLLQANAPDCKGSLSFSSVLRYFKDAVRDADEFYETVFLPLPADIFAGDKKFPRGPVAWALLSRLTTEDPRDVARASLLMPLLLVRDKNIEVENAFFAACFQAFLEDAAGDMRRASASFWKALDRYQMQIVSLVGDHAEMISAVYGATDGTVKDPYSDERRPCYVLADPDRFEAYCQGVDDYAREAGLSVDDTLKKIAWAPAALWLKDENRYRSCPVEQTARVLSRLASALNSVEVDDWKTDAPEGFDTVLDYLWPHRDTPEVVASLSDPDIIQLVHYQTWKERLAQWQLGRVSGFEECRTNCHALDRAQLSLPKPGQVRDIIQPVADLLGKQFNWSSPAAHETLRFIERSLLPNEVEMAVLTKLRCFQDGWQEIARSSVTDFHFLEDRAGLDSTNRKKALLYFLDLSDEPPSLNRVTEKQLQKARDIYRGSGELLKMVVLRTLFGNELENISDSIVYASARKIFLEKASDDESLVFLFDTYMTLLPPVERRFLLSLALAGFDLGVGGASALKRLIAAGGPLGGKMEQGLVTSGVVGEKFRAECMKSFEDFLPPTRSEIFKDLKEAFGTNYGRIVAVGRLLGSGSLNYVVEAFISDEENIHRVAVRIQKPHVSNQIENERQILLELVKRCKRHQNSQVKRFGLLIDALLNVAYRNLHPGAAELDLEQERDQYDRARNAYQNFIPDPTTGLHIEVARSLPKLQKLIVPQWQRKASVCEFVDHTKLEAVDNSELQIAIAIQEVGAEVRAIKSGDFDQDGHKGNWLIDFTGHRLVRTDYAQIMTLQNGLGSFAMLLSALIDPGSETLMQRLKDHFSEVFINKRRPRGFVRALRQAVTSTDLPPPTNPIERLLFVQNTIEFSLANSGVVVALRFRDDIAGPLASLLRCNMHRPLIEKTGEMAYLQKIGALLV